MKVMNKRMIAMFGALCVTALVPMAGSGAAAQGACDRACLDGLVDSYHAALLAHDPSKLPLAANIKSTENTNKVKLGDGLWNTIQSLGDFKIQFADPSTGQAVYMGTAVENGQFDLYGVRLKEKGRKITETETWVVREVTGVHGSFDASSYTTPDPLFSQPLAPSERVSRAQMIAAANAYFTGIVDGTARNVPFVDSTIRIENGQQAAPTPARDGHPAVTVAQQFEAAGKGVIHEVTNRRFPVVDEERGIVLADVIFQHPGNIGPNTNISSSMRSGRKVVSLGAYPNSTQIIEAFKIVNGKIYRIYAFVLLQNYRQDPGWPS